jgi:hypothetical protein
MVNGAPSFFVAGVAALIASFGFLLTILLRRRRSKNL